MAADWYRCKGSDWCDLYKIDINHPTLSELKGVYIIWAGKDATRKILKVGYGKISTEIYKIRDEIIIKAFKSHGVKVTFASVPEDQSKAIAIYLNKLLLPTISYNAPTGIPIKINLPW